MRQLWHRTALEIILSIALIIPALSSCTASKSNTGEILIGLKPDAIPLLISPEEPDPYQTGISSIDDLNYKWGVLHMIRVFSELDPDDETATRLGLGGIYKLVVSENTDLAAMIRDYQSDSNIDFAELNKLYEIK